MHERPVWHFDEFEVDLPAWRLVRAGRQVPLEPKALALLAFLIERQGDVVTKPEILDEVWKDVAVTENAMVRVVAQVRSALGDDPKAPKYIETVHTRGYRFVAPVTRRVAGEGAAPPLARGQTPGADDGAAATPAERVAREATLPGPSSDGRSASSRVAIGFAVALALAVLAYIAWSGRGPAASLTGTPAERDHSIAVLPLENLGPPAHRYFADGMTEALTTRLAKIEALKVISRSAVTRYRDDRPRQSVIARELGVATLVEGSALLASDRVRISVRLVDGDTDHAIWAEEYEGDLRDVVALQARVARAIVREIRVRVTPDEADRLASSSARNPVAYREYLQGLFEYERALGVDERMFGHLRQAAARFSAAIGLEPSWGEAHGRLALTHLFVAGMSDDHFERLREYKLAREVAVRALDLDPTVVSARIALARAGFSLDGDWEESERQYREVLRLEPNNADWSYGVFLTYAGRFDEALTRLRYARERWPTSSVVRFWIGSTGVCARRYDEAAAEASQLRDLLGDEVHATLLDAMVLVGQGRPAEAVALLDGRRESLLVNRATTYLQTVAYAAARAGQHDRARQAIRDLEARGSGACASILLALGDTSGAVQVTEQAYEQRDYSLYQARCAWEYDAMRRIPRIERILRDVLDSP